jgi:hypothetical protein
MIAQAGRSFHAAHQENRVFRRVLLVAILALAVHYVCRGDVAR